MCICFSLKGIYHKHCSDSEFSALQPMFKYRLSQKAFRRIQANSLIQYIYIFSWTSNVPCLHIAASVHSYDLVSLAASDRVMKGVAVRILLHPSIAQYKYSQYKQCFIL
jgi:hypothetical protein